MAAMANMHVPLPQDLYTSLRDQAARRKQPATVLVREAIEAWLHQQQRDEIDRQLSEYAAAMAGTDADHDPALEAAGIEHWIEEQKRSEGQERRREEEDGARRSVRGRSAAKVGVRTKRKATGGGRVARRT